MVKTGLGEEFAGALSDIETTVYSVKPGDNSAKKLYQNIIFETDSTPGGDSSAQSTDGFVNKNEFVLGDDSELTVIQFISTRDNANAGILKAAVSNTYDIGVNSRLTLVQIQDLPEDSEFYNDCGGKCADGGHFRRIQIVLGGGKTFMGDFCGLRGDRSSYTCDIAYYLQGEHQLDMNYIADHTGKRSESDINISGVMSENTSKIFRGTIDFHKGCSQSRGSEMEDVLLMDEGVVNRTVPLILCDEEDVEGSHGASIGRPDDNLVFYLASRSLDRDAIYHMMARAKIDRVAGLIDDKETLDRIDEIMGDGKKADD
ncbi:MAG: SufD family Fe-S cluster assembly protein [Lachnospiraceae bacterium]|nr:SufD family Fe-S cluster assembly protein [Lachnospiraceae bacterium]